jgi:F0F1-type ATP synthase delta subunit
MEKKLLEILCQNILITLDKKLVFLIKKSEHEKKTNDNKCSYIFEEIKVLEEATNFIKWIINNSSKEMFQKIIEEYKQEETDEENEEENEIDDFKTKDEIYGLFDEKISKKYKVEITLSKNKDIDFIGLELKRQSNDRESWKRLGKVRMRINKLEKILRRSKNMIYDKNKVNNQEYQI